MPVARPTRTLQPRCFPTVRCSIEHFSPVMYGSPAQTMRGILRVLSDPDRFALSGSIRLHAMHGPRLAVLIELGLNIIG
jgi:hypothetical protein